MRKFFLFLIAVLTVAYPLLVYFGLNYVSPAIFGLCFLTVAVLRFFLAPEKREPATVAILTVVACYSLTLALAGSQWMLLLYPVVVSWGVAAVFGLSLTKEVTLIESFAVAAGKTITADAKRYTRKLTLVWTCLLIANGLLSLYLAVFASLQAWALYCGLLSYACIAMFCLLEYLYRQHYIRKMGQ